MVEFSLKRCGGIFGMLYFDASWLMNSLLTSLTCESNCLKLDVAFAICHAAFSTKDGELFPVCFSDQ